MASLTRPDWVFLLFIVLASRNKRTLGGYWEIATCGIEAIQRSFPSPDVIPPRIHQDHP